MSDTIRVIEATSENDFKNALEDLGHDEFIEGIGVDDHGYYTAVVKQLDTTAIDKLKDDLDRYRKLADEVYEIMASDSPATHKVAQLAMTMSGAEDAGLVGDHVGTIELNTDAND